MVSVLFYCRVFMVSFKVGHHIFQRIQHIPVIVYRFFLNKPTRTTKDVATPLISVSTVERIWSKVQSRIQFSTLPVMGSGYKDITLICSVRVSFHWLGGFIRMPLRIFCGSIIIHCVIGYSASKKINDCSILSVLECGVSLQNLPNKTFVVCLHIRFSVMPMGHV